VTDSFGVADLLAALAVAVGLVGIVVPVLPGSLLILGAVLAWAVAVGETTGWVVFAVATTFLVLGAVVKYAVPGRRMRTAGVPVSTLVVGAVGAVVGFFVIPVVGFVVGFVGGVYLAEVRRLDPTAARATTVHAVKAVGLALLIELLAGLLAAATFAVGVVLT
jgi:uncharacterized protein YqgC (DUF456 family)